LRHARLLSRRRGRHRFHVRFRRVSTSAYWRLGFRQSGFRHITRIPRRTAPAPGHDRRFSAMLFSLIVLSNSGQASDPEINSSHLCPLRGRYSSAPRGAPTMFSKAAFTCSVSGCGRRENANLALTVNRDQAGRNQQCQDHRAPENARRNGVSDLPADEYAAELGDADHERESPVDGPAAEIAQGADTRHSNGLNLGGAESRSEEHTSELQSLAYLVCRLLL